MIIDKTPKTFTQVYLFKPFFVVQLKQKHTMGETMNVNVIDDTILGDWWVDTDRVKWVAINAIAQLPLGDGIAINIVMADAIDNEPPRGQRRLQTVGLCRYVSPMRYVIHVVANADWRLTLAHELYHVHEFVNGIPTNELACDDFALGLT